MIAKSTRSGGDHVSRNSGAGASLSSNRAPTDSYRSGIGKTERGASSRSAVGGFRGGDSRKPASRRRFPETMRLVRWGWGWCGPGSKGGRLCRKRGFLGNPETNQGCMSGQKPAFRPASGARGLSVGSQGRKCPRREALISTPMTAVPARKAAR